MSFLMRWRTAKAYCHSPSVASSSADGCISGPHRRNSDVRVSTTPDYRTAPNFPIDTVARTMGTQYEGVHRELLHYVICLKFSEAGRAAGQQASHAGGQGSTSAANDQSGTRRQHNAVGQSSDTIGRMKRRLHMNSYHAISPPRRYLFTECFSVHIGSQGTYSRRVLRFRFVANVPDPESMPRCSQL